jgi:hypothetical protein
MEQKPSIGRIVHYRLSEEDVRHIMRRRTTPDAIRKRVIEDRWPLGAQAHVGEPVEVGQVVPVLIVKTWSGDTISGRAFLDGSDELALHGVVSGDSLGTWFWPPRS